jgi:type IV pilus assembly protein PilE
MKKINLKATGFTLIELLITMVIICILAVVAYASYHSHVVKVRRNNAVINLNDLAARLENYYNQNHSYENATIENLAVKNDDEFYQLQITHADETSYQVAAVPQKSQASEDKKCGILMLDDLGNKTISGSVKVNECF